MAKVVKKSNLCVVVRKYQAQDGLEKSIWKTIGELTTFQKDDGSYNTIAELYTMPGIIISVFEQKEQNRQPIQQTQPIQQVQQEQEINLESLPF